MTRQSVEMQEGTAQVRAPTSYGELLQNSNYRFLWLGQLVSVFGDRLHQIALLVLVGSLTSNNLGQIGLVVATIGLPSLCFGLIAGALVDRWDRQRVMIAADCLRALLVVLLPIAARVDLVWVYVVTFLLTTVSLFFRPARDGLLPSLVPQHKLMSANAFSSSSETVMDVLGYPLAGALVGGLVGLFAGGRGITLAFWIDAGTYLFSALMIARIRLPRHESGAGELGGMPAVGVARMVADALRFVRATPALLANILLIASGALLAAGAATLSFGYAVEIARAGGFGYSILEAAIGLGNVVGALAIGKWGGRAPAGRLVLLGLAGLGATNAAVATTDNLWLAALFLALGGVANMAFVVPSVTLTQELTPNEYLGRVFSLRVTVLTTAAILSNVLLGVAAERYGVQPVFALSGGLLVALSLLAFFVPAAHGTPSRVGASAEEVTT